jgi:GWxTD domain-containing protein
MVDVLRYLMQPGLYEFSFYIEDLNDSTNTYTKSIEAKIEIYSETDISLSDIQFASSIKQAKMDKNNVFWKSGLEIVPNPGAIYGSRTPVLFYYLESYNLERLLKSDTYKNKAYITSLDGKVIEKINPRIQQKKVLNSSIEVGTINISSLSSGVFNFNFEIFDMEDSLRCSAIKKFYVYNPSIDVESEGEIENIEKAIVESEFTGMNEKELDNDFELTRYFTTSEQGDFYKKLDNAEAKRRFLFEIWKNVDPTPNTRINEFKLQYKQRIEDANEEFRSYARKGWKTDRGRVYILYGRPTDIERYPNNPTSYAHEIWHYDNIEGSIIFVFVDLQEFGEYIQIHSTKRGEPINNNWEEMIDKHIN